MTAFSFLCLRSLWLAGTVPQELLSPLKVNNIILRKLSGLEAQSGVGGEAEGQKGLGVRML